MTTEENHAEIEEPSPFTDQYVYERLRDIAHAEENDGYESGPHARIEFYEEILRAIADGMQNHERIARMALARPEEFLVAFGD